MPDNFDELMEFPSIYTFKIIGKNNDMFKKDVESVKTEDRNWEEKATPSSNDKFISYSLTTVVESSVELRSFYTNISKIREMHFYV